MTDWVRLWHDMPTDPKWRTIARKSRQRVGDVIAVFNFALVNASANATERGRTHGLESEDIATALDLEEADVQAILDAMIGKVLAPDGTLLGWQKRQPKREDSSAERSKAWRDERKRTQTNANERPETEKETDKEKNLMPDKSGDYAFFGQTIKLAPRHFNEWKRLFHTIPDLEAELSVLDAWWQTQPEDKRGNWFLATKGMLNKKHQQNTAIEKQAQAPPVWDGMA